MMIQQRWLGLLVVCGLLVGAAGRAAAERVRFVYGPADGDGHCQLQPSGPGVVSHRACWFGRGEVPFPGQPRPTCQVTLTNPRTGRPVTVPLALPPGTPRIEHVYGRTVYNYGSYTVSVGFLPDGSVEVIYNSGLLRGLTFHPDGAARVFYNGPTLHGK
jgi:hypothetical protein